MSNVHSTESIRIDGDCDDSREVVVCQTLSKLIQRHFRRSIPIVAPINDSQYNVSKAGWKEGDTESERENGLQIYVNNTSSGRWTMREQCNREEEEEVKTYGCVGRRRRCCVGAQEGGRGETKGGAMESCAVRMRKIEIKMETNG